MHARSNAIAVLRRTVSALFSQDPEGLVQKKVNEMVHGKSPRLLVNLNELRDDAEFAQYVPQ